MSVEFPIIDAHHHLWDISANYYPWLTDRIRERRFGDYAAIRRNYLPADLQADVSPLRLVGSVHVEASYGGPDPTEETRWVASLGRATGIPTGLVVHAELSDPSVAKVLARHLEAGPVKAVRAPLHWHPDPRITGINRPDLMTDPAWRHGLKRLGDLGLAFDLSIFPSQMAEAVKLAEAFPGIVFVLNHCGLPLHLDHPAGDPEGRREWESGIRAMGRVRNVTVKLSGLWMAGRPLKTPDVRPLVRHLVDSFGSSRMIFGSNFPVDRLHVSYEEMVAIYHDSISDLSKAEQRAIFAGNANRIYRLGLDL